MQVCRDQSIVSCTILRLEELYCTIAGEYVVRVILTARRGAWEKLKRNEHPGAENMSVTRSSLCCESRKSIESRSINRMNAHDRRRCMMLHNISPSTTIHPCPCILKLKSTTAKTNYWTLSEATSLDILDFAVPSFQVKMYIVLVQEQISP